MRRPTILLAAALAACSGGAGEGGARRTLPDVRLPTLAGPPGPSLASCPTAKCLTVLVAPWCGVCHATAPSVVAFRRYLDSKGVGSRVVVGLSDSMEDLRAFAAEFGADAMIDANGEMSARGVPMFLVNDAQGRVLKVVEGFPRSESAEGLAAYFGL